MAKVGELFQTADWKSEKHVPVIDCADEVKADERFAVKVTMGKEAMRSRPSNGWLLLCSTESTREPRKYRLSNPRTAR